MTSSLKPTPPASTVLARKVAGSLAQLAPTLRAGNARAISFALTNTVPLRDALMQELELRTAGEVKIRRLEMMPQRLSLTDRLDMPEEGERVAMALNSLGVVQEQKGQVDEALAYYDRAREIRERLGDDAGLAMTLNNLGVAHELRGDWDAALDHYGRARKIWEQRGDIASAAMALNNIGDIFYSELSQKHNCIGFVSSHAAPLRCVRP
jgi:tetratricopeptide (TPR) repeat protein